MKVGDAAREVGLSVHALRYWDDVGVVVPDRTRSGHREYTAEHLDRLRIAQACQGAGLSLTEIRLVLTRTEPGRRQVIQSRVEQIREQRAHLEFAERFLNHVIDCQHALMSRCDDCSHYAHGSHHRPPT